MCVLARWRERSRARGGGGAGGRARAKTVGGGPLTSRELVTRFRATTAVGRARGGERVDDAFDERRPSVRERCARDDARDDGHFRTNVERCVSRFRALD